MNLSRINRERTQKLTLYIIILIFFFKILLKVKELLFIQVGGFSSLPFLHLNAFYSTNTGYRGNKHSNFLFMLLFHSHSLSLSPSLSHTLSHSLSLDIYIYPPHFQALSMYQEEMSRLHSANNPGLRSPDNQLDNRSDGQVRKMIYGIASVVTSFNYLRTLTQTQQTSKQA